MVTADGWPGLVHTASREPGPLGCEHLALHLGAYGRGMWGLRLSKTQTAEAVSNGWTASLFRKPRTSRLSHCPVSELGHDLASLPRSLPPKPFKGSLFLPPPTACFQPGPSAIISVSTGHSPSSFPSVLISSEVGLSLAPLLICGVLRAGQWQALLATLVG